MKMILGLGLLFSFNAFANSCPSIEGDYLCQKGSRTLYKSIERTATGYMVTTDGAEIEYVTDKKTYSLPDLNDATDFKVTAYCEKNKLVVDFTATILYEGSPIAKQVSKSEYAPKGEGMTFVQKVRMKGLPMPTLKYECSKI